MSTENDDLKFYNKMNTENDDNHNESALNSSQDSEKNLWSPEEIIVLINVWEEYNKDLRKLGRHAKTYHQITERLQHILDREVPFTVRQVIKKIENLKRQYNYNKNKFQSEANPSPWRYYKMIHRFIHASPKEDKTLGGKEEVSVYQQNPPVEVLLEDGLAQMLERDLLRLRGEQTEETDSDSRSPTASSASTPALQSVTPTITNAPSTSTPAVNLPPQHPSESSFGSEGGGGDDLTQPVRDCHSSPSRKRSKNSLDLTNVSTDWVSDDESNFEDLLEEYFHRTSYELELMKNALTYFFTDSQNDELEFLLLDSLGGHQLKLIYWRELMTLRSDGERIRNEAVKDIIREVNQGQTEDILRERLKQQNLNYENFLQLHKWRESRISCIERELKGVIPCQNECKSRLEFLLGRLDARSNGIESKGTNLELKIDKILDLLVSSSSRMPKNGLKENNGC